MTRTTNYFGMSRTKKIFVAIVTLLATVLLIVPTTDTNAYAESAGARDLNTVLLPYAQELEKINSELGTDYIFVSGDELSETKYNDMVDFYQQMTLGEFHDYIYEVYQNDIASQSSFFDVVADIRSTNDEDLDNKGEVLSVNPVSTITQKFFYNSKNKNYLAITAEVMFGGGRAIYTKIISCTDTIYEYPGYVIYDSEYELSSDRSSVYVIFYCHRVLNENGLISTMNYQIPVTFEAANGDINGEFVR